MAKTRGGQVPSKPPIPPHSSRRRSNRILTRRSTDLGVLSTQSLTHRSKGKSTDPILIPDSSSSAHVISSPSQTHGTPLIFTSSHYALRFQDIMLNKTIVFGKSVDHALFQQIGVTALFDKVNLSAMLSPPKSAYPTFIKQFFGNMSVHNDVIKTFVKHKTLVFDSTVLGSILNIPCSGFCPFTLKGPIEFENLTVLEQLRIVKECSSAEFIGLPTVVETIPLNNVIHKLIRANLVPRNGGRSNMTYQDLILYALILSGTKFNFALLMIKHMESCLTNKTKCFPYGSFLTKILTHFGISFVNEDVVKVSDVLDKYILSQSKLTVNSAGTLCWEVEKVPTSTPPSPPSSPLHHSTVPDSTDPPPPSTAQNSTLFQLIHDMGTRFDSAFLTVSNKIQELNAKVDYVSGRMEVLISHHNDYVLKIKDFDKKLDDVLYEPAPDPAA